jgi:phage FluMu gp28-like protein
VNHDATIERYQRALPANEFAGLSAWLSTFYRFQLDWLLDQAQQAVCNKSRQIGLSHTTAGFAVLRGAFHGETTTIISSGQLESDEVLDKCKRHASVLAKLGCRMSLTPERNNATQMVFASGGRILSLPSTGGRSFSGNVFLDEYAYQEHASKVWDAAAAVTTLGGMLRVSSTPNGVGNEFADLWTKVGEDESLSSWSRHEIPIDVAVADGYPVDLDRCWTIAKGDQRLFNQLFRCQFLDGSLQYLPTALIDDCLSDRIPFGAGPCFAGLDVGKEADRTVLVVLQRDGSVNATVYVETKKRTDSDGLDDMVERAFKRFSLRALCVDSTGIGSFPAERMAVKHGQHKVFPVTFTLGSKEEMATSLYSAVKDGTLRLPKDDSSFPSMPDMPGNCGGVATQLRLDLSAIQRIVTSAGNVRYDAPRTAAGHADSAWAMALALKAAGHNAPSWLDYHRATTSGR